MPKRKLLLADDSVTIQKVVDLTFAGQGVEVISAAEGASAMEKILEFSPDLVLADVNLPGLNGYELCEMIKQTEALRRTAVILLVGSFEPYDEERARFAGADDFLTKPFQSIRQLVDKVTALLDPNQDRKSAVPGDNTVSEEKINPVSLGNSTSNEDDMTNSASSFALDEAPKFESKDSADASDEPAQTRQFPPQELQDFSPGETSNQDSSAQNFIEENNLTQTNDEANTAASTYEQNRSGKEENSGFVEENQSEVAPQTQIQNLQLSPEAVEAIAQQISEKLSEQMVKNIAREVLRQMADLIIKNAGEEKREE